MVSSPLRKNLNLPGCIAMGKASDAASANAAEILRDWLRLWLMARPFLLLAHVENRRTILG